MITPDCLLNTALLFEAILEQIDQIIFLDLTTKQVSNKTEIYRKPAGSI
jgi:hypothetical protein